jgi:3-hydroxyisobutyrate dehydrogenase-like beta-hydroxyacid dehydrogenase
MDIGFVGLGNMGKGIAQSLIRAGHRLRVWNRSPGPAEELVKLGAEVAHSPRDAFGGDAFVSMLADDGALREVVLEGNVLPQKGGNTVHICMATISVGFAKELTQLHRARNIPFISAPVLGRPDVAATGKLAILAAGEPKIIERVQPLLDAAGQKTWRFGDEPSNANLVKIAANFMLASAIETIAEARALVEANDIPADQFLALITSTLFDAPVYKGYGGIIARRQYEPAGFRLALGFKDVRLALAAAETAHVPLPFAGILRDHFLDAVAHGDEAKDWSAVAEVAMRHAGLTKGGLRPEAAEGNSVTD